MENLNAEIITQSNYLEKDGIDAYSAICCEESARMTETTILAC